LNFRCAVKHHVELECKYLRGIRGLAKILMNKLVFRWIDKTVSDFVFLDETDDMSGSM